MACAASYDQAYYCDDGDGDDGDDVFFPSFQWISVSLSRQLHQQVFSKGWLPLTTTY